MSEFKDYSAWSLPEDFSSDEIGPPVRLGAAGYMTLTLAAYWIATEGGKKRILARDASVWRGAFNRLLSRIQSNDVEMVGRRHGLESVPSVMDYKAFAP